jgi:predicted PurR-regulated permease PerM
MIQDITRGRRVFSPWYYNKAFRYMVLTTLVLFIVYLSNKIGFLLAPIFAFVSSIFAPILIAFIFYYLLRPIIYTLEKWRIPRLLSILTIYLIFAILLILFLAYMVPILVTQVTAIANTSVTALENMHKSPSVITIGPFTLDWQHEVETRLLSFLQQITTDFSRNVVDVLGTITRVATVLVTIPFILFYLLNEDQDFSSKFLKSVPEDYAKEVRKILHNIDSTLASYITGLVLISLSVGMLFFIGYLIIGIDYALILAVVAFIFTTIPYVGPFIAITPAILLGLSSSLFMALKVGIVFAFVQIIESNFISPQIIGQRLHIHPLTIILLLLAAGTLYGLVGLILATPIYAVAKVLFENLHKIYRLRYPRVKAEVKEV